MTTLMSRLLWSALLIVPAWGGQVEPFKQADPSHFPPASPESQGMSSQHVAAFAEIVRGYVERGEAVGAEVLVIKNRRTVLHEAFGWNNREDAVHMERNTVFNIRSMTKPVTGTAALLLVDDGKLDLDAPLARYLSELGGDLLGSVTARQLLTHRSGLPLSLIPAEAMQTARIDSILGRYADLREVALLATDAALESAPGAEFQYSDAGSELLGYLVSRIAEMPLEAFVRTRILEPIGMSHTLTLLDSASAASERAAAAYAGRPRAWMRYFSPGAPSLYPFLLGSQGLYATPADYARFMARWMDLGCAGEESWLDGRIAAAALTPVSEMEYPTGFSGLRVWYGQMWMLYVDEEAGSRVVAFGHGGSDGTAAWAWPEEDLMVLYFTQSRGGMTVLEIESEIDRYLRDRPEQLVEPAARSDDRALVGTYVTDFRSRPNEQYEILLENGTMKLRIPQGLDVPLLPADAGGKRSFSFSPDQGVSFEETAEGEPRRMWIHSAVEMLREPVDSRDAETVADGPEGRYVIKGLGPAGGVFEIVGSDEGLAFRDPQGTLLRMSCPEAGGRCPFEGMRYDGITFKRNASGAVAGLVLHQAFACRRGALEPEATLELADVEPYLGTYHDPQADVDVEVVFDGAGLGVKSPLLSAVVEFQPPDAEGRWFARVNPSVAIRFNREPDGRVTSFTALTPMGEFERPRVK